MTAIWPNRRHELGQTTDTRVSSHTQQSGDARHRSPDCRSDARHRSPDCRSIYIIHRVSGARTAVTDGFFLWPADVTPDIAHAGNARTCVWLAPARADVWRTPCLIVDPRRTCPERGADARAAAPARAAPAEYVVRLPPVRPGPDAPPRKARQAPATTPDPETVGPLRRPTRASCPPATKRASGSVSGRPGSSSVRFSV